MAGRGSKGAAERAASWVLVPLWAAGQLCRSARGPAGASSYTAAGVSFTTAQRVQR